MSLKRALILGGGVAGAATAERLARLGWEVHLVEKAADIGGHAARWACKATDVCLRCNVCLAESVLRSVRNNKAIVLHLNHTIAALSLPEQGPVVATLTPTAAVGVDVSGLSPILLEADALILATGFEPYDPRQNPAWGYGRLANVITGVEVEQFLAERGTLVRPSDGQPPRTLAFVQCVGSRTSEIFRRPEDTNYCSAVCCAYALRTARHILHHCPQTEITIFFMDLQSFGKGFQNFYESVCQKVRLVRSRPCEIIAAPENRVLVRYAAEGGPPTAPVLKEEMFDLVVLSVGIRSSSDSREMAELVGIPLDEHGFFLTNSFYSGNGTPPRIFAVGTCTGPQDIARCLAQADAVALAVVAHSGGVAPTARGSSCPRAEGTKIEPLSRDVAIVGGGVAALWAAAKLADLGHNVLLIAANEKQDEPVAVGHLADSTQEARKRIRALFAALWDRIRQHPKVSHFPNARLSTIDGQCG
ncbi:MAG: FAD-dependent oxidoreductase, partial [Kiritimatiellia bacterium]